MLIGENKEYYCSLCGTKKHIEYDCKNCELYNYTEGTYINGSGRNVDSGPYKSNPDDTTQCYYLCIH